MSKITNLLGNSEDLISQFMLENDPTAAIAGLKEEIVTEQKILDTAKEANTPIDSTFGIKKNVDLEELFRDEDDSDLENEDDLEEIEDLNIKTEAKKVETPVKEKATEKPAEVEYDYENFINYLAQEGIVDLDEGEEFEDSDAGLTSVIQKTINKQIDGYKKGLPTIAHEFIEFIENGGDPAKFLGAVSGPIDYASLDMNNESDQELIVREYLKSQDYDNAEIKETIESYKDGLLLDKQALIAQKKLAKISEVSRRQVIAEAENQVQIKKQNYNKYISDLTGTIKNSKSIAGLEIKDKEKDEFQKWLLNPGKDGLTGYQREVQVDPILTQVELAFLKFKKYDFSKVAKAAESEATKRIKLSLTKSSDRNPRGSTGSNLGNSEESNSKEDKFGAFKGFLK